MKEGYKKTELGWIPNEWKLDNINKITYLNPESLGNSTDENLIINYIDIESVKIGKVLGYKKFKFSEAPSRARRVVMKNDVIISTVRPNLKSIAKINFDKENLICSTGFAVLRKKETIDSEYLFQFVMSDIFTKQLVDKTVGSNYPAVNSNDIKETLIFVPPLKEQEKIADILSTVDSQIDDTDKLIEKTKELKKGLMQRLLTKGVGHTEFKKTEVGEIPVEWEVKSIGEVAKVGSSKRVYQSDYTKEGIPFYRSKEIIELSKGKEPSIELYIDEEKYNRFEEKFGAPKQEDLLITSVGSVGKTWVSDGRKFYYKDGNLTQIDSNKNINTKFISYVFKSDYLIKQYMGQSNGSAQVALTIKQLKKLIIAFPNLDEQKKIVKILLSVDNQIEEYENKKMKLEELKKGLIQKLLTGKIRVI